jgi:molecular chaperone DnaK (HSP70)
MCIYIQAVKASQRSQQRLRKAVEAAKRNLSTANDVDIEVESLVDGANFSVKLTRAAFEKLCAPLFVRCIDTVKSVIRDAGATLELVTDVVLVCIHMCI